jgi:two-component system response regulator YesN
VERLVAGLVGPRADAFLTRKDMEELVLILKGEGAGQVERAGQALAGRIRREVEAQTACGLAVGIGSPQARLGDVHHSFAEALVRVRNTAAGGLPRGPAGGADQTELLKLDEAALEDYLKCGMAGDFDAFFDACIQPPGTAALRSYLVKNYIFVDIVLTTAQFVSDLGGDVDRVIPEINDIERLLAKVKTMAQIREETRRIFTGALAFRDSRVRHERAMILHQARLYIDRHCGDSNLSLHEVAAQVNLSPSHFSAVFSQETGETFRDYLARVRIERAKELLRTTSLKCFEVAERSGYNDPHYFSYIFRKNTGLSPQQFRLQPQARKHR